MPTFSEDEYPDIIFVEGVIQLRRENDENVFLTIAVDYDRIVVEVNHLEATTVMNTPAGTCWCSRKSAYVFGRTRHQTLAEKCKFCAALKEAPEVQQLPPPTCSRPPEGSAGGPFALPRSISPPAKIPTTLPSKTEERPLLQRATNSPPGGIKGGQPSCHPAEAEWPQDTQPSAGDPYPD